jgi:membrane protein YdbS with pleckstrin-like domain
MSQNNAPREGSASDPDPDHGAGQHESTSSHPGGEDPNREVLDKPWMVLAREENILWWGQPSFIPNLPTLLVSTLVVLASIAVPVFVSGEMAVYALVGVPLGLGMGIYQYLTITSRYYVITDDKVVRKFGIIRRETIEVRYENIEYVNAKQNIIERLFSFGDISIASAGTDIAETYLDDVRTPQKVSRLITQQKDNAYNALSN